MRLKMQNWGQLRIGLWGVTIALACGVVALTSHRAMAQDADGSAPPPSNWITYRGNLQRTGSRAEKLGAMPNLVWQFTSTDDPQTLYSAPLVAGPPGQRRAYFAAGDKMYCLDGETGASIWSTQSLPSAVTSPPILLSGDNGDVLYCITSTGDVIVMNPVNGTILKDIPLGMAVQNVAPVPVQTASGTRLIVGTVAGKLVAIDPEKMEVDPSWSLSLGRFGAAITATPALTPDGKYLYVPAEDENIYVVDVAKAKVYYPIQMRYGIVGSPVIAGNSVIVANGTLITCLKLNGGQTSWADSLDVLLSVPPAVQMNADGSGNIYAGSSSGMFYDLNLADGKILWKTNLNDSITGPPTSVGDMVLVGTQRGMLYGLDPQKGNLTWEFRLNTQRVVTDTNTRGGRFGGFNRGAQNQNGADNAPDVPPPGTLGVGAPDAGAAGAAGDDNAGMNNAANNAGDDDDDNNASNSTAPTATTNYNRLGQEVATYPVSTAPTVVDGQIFVAADNLAVYAFNTQPFDAEPPLLQNLIPYVYNSQNDLQDVSASRSIPGRPPVILKGQLDDDGSGVDPSSIKVLLNGVALTPDAISYDPLTGNLQIRLTETPDKSDTTLENGSIKVAIQAKDYQNNTLNSTTYIRVDNAQAAPQPTDTAGGGAFGRFRR